MAKPDQSLARPIFFGVVDQDGTVYLGPMTTISYAL